MKLTLKKAGIGLLAAAAVTVAAAPVMAHGRVGPVGGPAAEPRGIFQEDFAAIDVDGNGQITEEDLLARAEARFAEVDSDGNGALDAAELSAQVLARIEENARMRRGDPQARAEQIAERMLERRDADGNGTLSVAELGPENGFGRVIDRFDTDDDNAISAAEFDTAKAEMSNRLAKRGQGHRGGPGPRR